MYISQYLGTFATAGVSVCKLRAQDANSLHFGDEPGQN